MKKIQLTIMGIKVNPHPTEDATNFDIRITKAEAEWLLKWHGNQLPFDIMCREYGEDRNWVGLTPDDIDGKTEKLNESYRTFEIWHNNVKPLRSKTMSYIVIERFGGAEYAGIVTDTDGNNLVFDSKEEAEAEASDCQDGIIVEL